MEILHLSDTGERSIGTRRNDLLGRACGRFVAFIDDDAASADYVARVCETIRDNPEIDCIGLRGGITFRGGHPREFVHSLRYGDYFSRNHTYCRPPYHLNPVRREIAVHYLFADVSYSEDIDWALRIRRDGALRKEAYIDSVLYFYRSRRAWGYQWLLDHTKGVRHRFGIHLANRLAVREVILSATGVFLRARKATGARR